MAKNFDNNDQIKQHNSDELTEQEIFEKAKEDLIPIQENLSDKKITIDEAKSELKKINEWLQGSELEVKDKKELGNAFDKLTKNLEKNIDENSLQIEFNEVVNLLETLTNKELASLKWSIPKSKFHAQERPAEVEAGIKESSRNLATTIDDASKDSNIIARTVGGRMKKLMS